MDRSERMDGSEGDQAAARIVPRSQARRSVNERIAATNERFDVGLGEARFVCECADEHCSEQITVPLMRYEQVRLFRRQFIVLADHVDTRFEEVVEQGDGYVVVEKFEEAGQETR